MRTSVYAWEWHVLLKSMRNLFFGDMAERLRRSVKNLVMSTRVGSNPVVGTTNHKPAVNSSIHPSEVGN